MGVRPENIELVDAKQNNKNEFHFQTEMDMAELMGSETLLYFKLNDETIIAKVNSMENFYPGQKCSLGIDFDHIHFFDKETGMRIPMNDADQMEQVNLEVIETKESRLA